MKTLRILCAIMRFDYGDPERGLSFEHWNLVDPLEHMGHQVLPFDFMSHYRALGRKKMNRRLWEMVRAEQPDLLLTFLFREELDKRILKKISEETDTITLNWFADDHWRFDNYSRSWAPCFNWVVTTAHSAVPKYAAMGYENVILSQWGVNQHRYRKQDLPLTYDVSFVGQPHGHRRELIGELRRAGFEVSVWGYGWGSGRLSQDDMIRVFNQSRINLNLSNAAAREWRRPPPSMVSRLITGIGKGLDRFEAGRRFKARRRERLRRLPPGVFYPEQIKGRNFEIPGCGGFCLSGMAEHLDQYFDLGRETVCFSSLEDLVAKIEYYLHHEDERAEIARAGHARALAEHTYEHRFGQIFAAVGLL